MAKNGGLTAHHKRPKNEKEAKAWLAEARHREQHAKTRKARNAWRRVVKRRAHILKAIVARERAARHPHIVHHKHPQSPGFEYVVRGGTPDERLLFAARYAHHNARIHYLEGGIYLPGYALHNVPGDGDRSDCSWWFLELRRICGLPDFVHGDVVRFTGSIIDHGREVSKHYAMNNVGVGVLFGSGSAFHVGMTCGGGTEEIWQHGTPTFRKGTFGQFGAGTEVRYFAFEHVASAD